MPEQGRADQTTAGASDAELVTATLSGELGRFDALVERYQKRAYAVAFRLLGNGHDAQEVCQDAFLKAYRSLSTLQEAARFGPWLLRIVSNLSLNFRRGRRRAASLPDDDALTDAGPSDGSGARPRVAAAPDASGSELAEVIEKAIAGLPEKQRLALVLFAIEGWPQKDVAELLGCSLEAVKWNVFQARKTLKGKLGDYL